MDTAKALAKIDKQIYSRFAWDRHPNFVDVSSYGDDLTRVINESQLNFEVELQPLQLPDGRKVNANAVVRKDNQVVIADAVGPQWTPVQNTQKFDWFRPYLDKKDTKLIKAGYLGNGEKVCLIARLNHNTNVEISKGDEIAKYLLLTDTFEQGYSLKVMLLIARLVCSNGMISTSDGSHIKMRHHRKIQNNLDNLHHNIELWNNGFDHTIEEAKFLAGKKVQSEKQLTDYYMQVMDFKEKVDEETGEKSLATRSENTLNILKNLFEDNEHNGTGRTWWNAYNGLTAYTSHIAGRNPDTSLDSLWFGQSSVRQRKAMTLALDFAGKV